jgi:hypothetical protein
MLLIHKINYKVARVDDINILQPTQTIGMMTGDTF